MAKRYAVRKGHSPGIYSTWACGESCKRIQQAEFKSFKSKQQRHL